MIFYSRAGASLAVLLVILLLLPAEVANGQALPNESDPAVEEETASAELASTRLRYRQAEERTTRQVARDLPLLRLDELLEEVRINNPSLRAARFEAEALETRAAQVSVLPDPMVMGTYQPFPIMTARGAQRSQWRVEQQLPYPGKLGLYGDIAGLGADVALFEAETFEKDLLTQVKQAYYELYRLQEQVVLVEYFRNRLLAFEDVATTQYEVGTGMQQSILKAQLEKNALSQRLIDLETRRRTAVETLSRLVNRPIEDGFEVRVDTPQVLSGDLERMLSLAMDRRPEVDALDAAEARAEKQILLARKQFLPDFGVNMTYFDMSASDMMPTATGRDALAVGVSLKVPLQRGRLQAQLDEARIRAAQVDSRREAIVTSFRTQIGDFVTRLEREAEQLELYQDLLIPQAESTLEATLSAYSTGRTGFLDLLDAERMLFMLHMSYEDALLRYLNASAGLERALGISALDEVNKF